MCFSCVCCLVAITSRSVSKPNCCYKVIHDSISLTMGIFQCWKRKRETTSPLGGLPERPLLARDMMWNSNRFPRWGHVLSTTTTTTSTSHEYLTEDPALTEHYFPILRRVLLTSDLGTWKGQYKLRFACIIPGDSPLAMFTTSKKTSKMGWFNGPNRGRCLRKFRCRWRNGLPRIRSACTVRCTINNRWQYKICRRSIIRWDPHWEILLVDHKKLLADYETQEKSKKNRRRVAKILKQFHKVERQTLRGTTGAEWADWGDWNIYPATPAEVAQMCRLEGRGFEELLGKRPGSGKRYKIRRCLRDISKGLKKVFSR